MGKPYSPIPVAFTKSSKTLVIELCGESVYARSTRVSEANPLGRLQSAGLAKPKHTCAFEAVFAPPPHSH